MRKYIEKIERELEEKNLKFDIAAYKRAEIDPYLLLSDVFQKIFYAFSISKEDVYKGLVLSFKERGLTEEEAKEEAEIAIKELYSILAEILRLVNEKRITKELLEMRLERLFYLIDTLFIKETAEDLKRKIRIALALLE